MDEVRLNIIMLSYKNHNEWKRLVTEILVEIYGDNLKYLSAKGTRGTMGVHPKLFSAVHRKSI